MDIAALWHFPRTELAQQYLQLLTAGPVAQTTIFAPRRTGKTAFLLRDLKPAAEAAGFIVAYADLWQTPNPALSLLRALEEAAEPKGAAERAMAFLKTPVKKMKAGVGAGALTGEMELELADPKSASTEVALRIDQLVGELCARKRLLLLIDEAQGMAKNKEGLQLARSLRTALTKHLERTRVVFTGSSRTQLSHVFSNAHAPLYSAGYAIREFPLLGREFVEYLAGRFAASTGRTLDVDQAMATHLRFHSRPEALVHCIASMVFEPTLTLADAQALELARQAQEETHAGAWLGLDALQKQLVRSLAADPGYKPFSGAALAMLRTQLGVDKLQTTHVQKAMATLARLTIVNKTPRNTWEFENEHFRDWVNSLED
jgi:hypothetical protein